MFRQKTHHLKVKVKLNFLFLCICFMRKHIFLFSWDCNTEEDKIHFPGGMTKKHHQQDSEGIDSKHSCREKTHFNISKVLRKSLPISRNHNYQSEKEALFYRLHVFLIFFPFFNCPTKCRISLLWSCTLTDPWYKVARAPDEVQ